MLIYLRLKMDELNDVKVQVVIRSRILYIIQFSVLDLENWITQCNFFVFILSLNEVDYSLRNWQILFTTHS